jgi:hypothetical protein
MSDVVLNFQPAHAAIGGAILGVATVGKLLLTGRILGISGTFKVRPQSVACLHTLSPPAAAKYLDMCALALCNCAVPFPATFRSFPGGFASPGRQKS